MPPDSVIATIARTRSVWTPSSDRLAFPVAGPLDPALLAGLRPIAAEWLDVDEAHLPMEVSWGLEEWGVPQAPGGYEVHVAGETAFNYDFIEEFRALGADRPALAAVLPKTDKKDLVAAEG